jgi:hypothetical protein
VTDDLVGISTEMYSNYFLRVNSNINDFNGIVSDPSSRSQLIAATKVLRREAAWRG